MLCSIVDTQHVMFNCKYTVSTISNFKKIHLLGHKRQLMFTVSPIVCGNWSLQQYNYIKSQRVGNNKKYLKNY